MIATVTNAYDQLDGTTNVVLNIANDPAAQKGMRRFVNKGPISLGIFASEELDSFTTTEPVGVVEPEGFEVELDGVTGQDFYGDWRAILSDISDEVAEELETARANGASFRLLVEVA